MGVYDRHDFRARVDYAAGRIANNQPTTRAFDTCFEMFDGDAVSLALLRRTLRRPCGRLARNIWQYLRRESVEPLGEKYAGCNLDDLAAHLRQDGWQTLDGVKL